MENKRIDIYCRGFTGNRLQEQIMDWCWFPHLGLFIKLTRNLTRMMVQMSLCCGLRSWGSHLILLFDLITYRQFFFLIVLVDNYIVLWIWYCLCCNIGMRYRELWNTPLNIVHINLSFISGIVNFDCYMNRMPNLGERIVKF